MEYVYAALLLHKLGQTVNDANITKVIQAAGGKVDEAKVKTIVASLAGVDINKELENASVMAVASAAPSAEKKEEKEEVKTEAAAEGLSALFG
jgi:large subunit ribosomal protein L12